MTVAAVVVGKKLGPKMGPKSARGPPVAHDHHLMTNKNYVSTARGGPWSPLFERMAAKAGMKLKDAENIAQIPEHGGPHPRAYHQEVFDRLSAATEGLSGSAYTAEFRAELARIRADVATPGSKLNQLLRKD